MECAIRKVYIKIETELDSSSIPREIWILCELTWSEPSKLTCRMEVIVQSSHFSKFCNIALGSKTYTKMYILHSILLEMFICFYTFLWQNINCIFKEAFSSKFKYESFLWNFLNKKNQINKETVWKGFMNEHMWHWNGSVIHFSKRLTIVTFLNCFNLHRRCIKGVFRLNNGSKCG